VTTSQPTDIRLSDLIALVEPLPTPILDPAQSASVVVKFKIHNPMG